MAQTFNVTERVHIVVRNCHQRVSVVGGEDANHVLVDGEAHQQEDTILVENSPKVALRVPRAAAVTVTDSHANVRMDNLSGTVQVINLHGDLVLRGLTGPTLIRDLHGDMSGRGLGALKGEGAWRGDVSLRGVESLDLPELGGDLSLDDAGTAVIQALDGDLSVRGIRGALRLGQIEGDVSLRDVAGDLNIAHVEGDLIASGLQGAVDAPEVEGDAVVSLQAVSAVVVRAEGDVVVHLPTGANADLEVDAPHGDVVARGGFKIVQEDENHLRATMGTGGVPVQVESLHADVIVRVGIADAPHRVRPPIPPVPPDFPQPPVPPFGNMETDFSEMGRRIAEETRESVRRSLTGFGFGFGRHHGHSHGRHGHRVREQAREDLSEAREQEETPRGATAGSPERQAILDAIARGELSVDDAIRKIRGEE